MGPAGAFAAPPGHAGYAQSSVSGASTNPANYTASSNRTTPHNMTTAGSQNHPYGKTNTHGMTTFNQMSYTTEQGVVSKPPTSSSSPDDILSWVENQLDMFGRNPILSHLVLLGPSERRRGGTKHV